LYEDQSESGTTSDHVDNDSASEIESDSEGEIESDIDRELDSNIDESDDSHEDGDHYPLQILIVMMTQVVNC